MARRRTLANVLTGVFTGVVVVFIGLILVMFISLCSVGKKGSDTKKVDDCVLRGISYFKEIGSYPTLSDGRDAYERLRRTRKCFLSSM